MTYGAILASGLGKRFGASIPKQFLPLGEKEILLYSVTAFAQSGFFDKIIVSVPESFIDYTVVLLSSAGLSADVICGGRERFESLEKICRHIESSYEIYEDDIVISHDGVRPFVTADIIKRNIDAVKQFGFSATAIKTTDTIIEKTDSSVSLPDRKNLYNLQTPQGFFASEFIDLYKNLSPAQKESLTDASAVYIMNDKKIELVEGSPFNIKITTEADMISGEALILKGLQKSY